MDDAPAFAMTTAVVDEPGPVSVTAARAGAVTEPAAAGVEVETVGVGGDGQDAATGARAAPTTASSAAARSEGDEAGDDEGNRRACDRQQRRNGERELEKIKG
jgi:hypothetical protein